MATEMPKVERTWLDKAIGWVSPQAELARLRARTRLAVWARHYEGAERTRRTAGWRRPGSDPNATGVTLRTLRDTARDMVRNNGHAESALDTIVQDVIGGPGITAGEKHDRWKAWAKSTDVTPDGTANLAGVQELVMRTVVEAGECLIRRRWRRLSDGLALPFQLQILEPDFIDDSKHQSLPNGGQIIYGVEYNPIGQRVAYWLYPEHPGSRTVSRAARIGQSVRVPASELAHVFHQKRAGQVRGASWFAPTLIRFHDQDELADALLMQAKVASLLGILTSDPEGTSAQFGEKDDDNEDWDWLEPGGIRHIPPGRSVDVVQPPRLANYPEYSQTNLREIAAGIRVTYEDMTGDYTELPYSASRMSRLKYWARVEGWRWRMLVPQMMDPVWRWGTQAAQLLNDPMPAATGWTAPGMPMLDPDKEGLAAMRNIRAGVTNLYEVLRERGWDPPEFVAEVEKIQQDLDEAGIILDSDPRYMTQNGQQQPGWKDDGEPAALALMRTLASMDKDEASEVMQQLQAELASSGNGAGART